jgi:hypothetical protein
MADKVPQWIRLCVDYWRERFDESEIGVDWSDAMEHCWRCGSKRKLQKCHIVAKQFGGGDGQENTLPLCCECHDEAPDVTDPSEIWRWIKETKSMFYGTLKFERAAMQAVSRGCDLSRFSRQKFDYLMEHSVGLHLMQNGTGCRIKSSSIAWAIEMACRTEATDGTSP